MDNCESEPITSRCGDVLNSLQHFISKANSEIESAEDAEKKFARLLKKNDAVAAWSELSLCVTLFTELLLEKMN